MHQLQLFHINLHKGPKMTHTNLSTMVKARRALFSQVKHTDANANIAGSRAKLSLYSLLDSHNISCAIEESKPSVNNFFQPW